MNLRALSSRMILVCIVVVFCINLGTGQNKTLEFLESVKNDSIYLDLKNYMYGPVLITLNYTKEFIRGPGELVIGSKEHLSDIIAIPISMVEDTSEFNWTDVIEADAELGDPYNSEHNDTVLYQLPFPKGKSYNIMQSWNGSFSHHSKQSRYAVDFALQEEDTICAARSGIVIRTVDHYTENGGPELTDRANQVVILHDDGTMGFYVHLLHKGVLVQPGDTVKTGQIIGLSGNTGYSSKPHLHFVVREAPDKAVPTYFQGYGRKKLKKGS